MPRYEYKDEKSSKFWEIQLEGDTFTVRFGKIGADGTVQQKVFADADKARKEYEKAISKKVKKGYQEVAGAEVAAAPSADANDGGNPDLEAAIHADPTNRQAWQVYADWLETQGDPRGELIQLHYALEDGAGDKRKLNKRSKALFEEHASDWMGPQLAKLVQKAADGDDSPFELDWWCGFVIGAKVGVFWDAEIDDTPAQIRILLSSPAARFLRDLRVGLDKSVEDGEADFGKSMLAITRLGKRPSLHNLHIGDFEYPDDTEISWTHVGDVSRLFPVLPNLRSLHVTGGNIQLGELAHPTLEALWLETGGLPKAAAKSLSKADLPALTKLEVWFGQDDYGGNAAPGDLKGLFKGDGYPKLTWLGLCNAEIADALAKAVVKAPILAQLDELHMKMGTMTVEGAEALLAAKDKLAHLKVLNLEENGIPEETVAELVKAFGDKVNTESQFENSYDGDVYVAVGE